MRSSRNDLKCLGLESTAHTFGASVASGPRNGKILSDVKDLYKPAPGSGIHPREAATHHAKVAPEIVREALRKANLTIEAIDCIAFAMGPGLGACLRVGAVVARALSSYARKSLVAVNHAVGHIELATLLTGSKDPITLLVSGGHTAITALESGRWRVFGETLDLTIGQLVDQFGRELGYSSPSGQKIESLAAKSSRYINLPYSVKGNDVSLSGTLTAAKKLLSQGAKAEDIAYSIQETAFAMITEVTERALAFTQKHEVLLTGGVAANTRLQKMLRQMGARHGATFYVVPKEYTGDCGAQIAWTGLLSYASGNFTKVAESMVKQSWRVDKVDISWRS